MTDARVAMRSPVGMLTITERDGTIVALDWGGRSTANAPPTPLLTAARAALERYFAGENEAFDLPLAPAGTPFQRRVFALMRKIPAGMTRSYGDLATALNSSPRAVGNACGVNPIPIIIPCHRVLAAGRRLGGYSGRGGVETKRILLQLEGVLLS